MVPAGGAEGLHFSAFHLNFNVLCDDCYSGKMKSSIGVS